MKLISQKEIIIKRTFVPDRYVKNKSIIFGSYDNILRSAAASGGYRGQKVYQGAKLI
ncbi:hypothetical protein D3C77_763710 [compost metagenome]